MAKARVALDLDQIEIVLNEFKSERAELIKQIEAKSLTDEQIMGIKQGAAMIAADLCSG